MLRPLVTFLAASLVASAALAALTVGEPAPSFSGTDVLSGKTVSNEALKGKIVVLEWNNFECPFVQKFYGSGTMQKLQAAAVKDGVVWVTVNSSAQGKEGYLADAAAAKAIVKKRGGHQSHYLLDHDGSIGHAFGAKATPHMFVIDAKGNIAYQGAIDDTPTPDIADLPKANNYVTAALASLKASTPIATATTKVYGCSVKY